MFVTFMNASFGLHPHGPHGHSSSSQAYMFIETQEEVRSFGIHMLHQRLFSPLWGAAREES